MIGTVLRKLRSELNQDYDVAGYDDDVIEGMRVLLNDCVLTEGETNNYTKTLAELYTHFGMFLECGSSNLDYIEKAVQTALAESGVSLKLKPRKKKSTIADLEEEIRESAILPKKMLAKLDILRA